DEIAVLDEEAVTAKQTAEVAEAKAYLQADGSIVAWGDDQLGPVSSAPLGTGFTKISGRGYNGLALRADGSIAAWGRDNFGVVSGAPTGGGFTDIAVGSNHAYALRADGSLVAWGLDFIGSVSNTPSGTGFTAIAAESGYGLAIGPAQPAVPEPSTLVLAGLGAVAVLRRRLCRRAA
ncbi:MAG: PEP-CTERM sorting domain-containing protein, partial [Planctomycetaceae bacterium]